MVSALEPVVEDDVRITHAQALIVAGCPDINRPLSSQSPSGSTPLGHGYFGCAGRQ
jgi:hypothetical protein